MLIIWSDVEHEVFKFSGKDVEALFFFLKDIVPVPPLPNSVNPIMYGGLFKTPSNFVASVEPLK